MRYLRATDLAACCDVDLKTVHNWCNEGEVKHFRSPGRHIRLDPADVIKFLEGYGYKVPAPWRVMASENAAAEGA